MPKATKEASKKSSKDLVSKETSKIQKKSNSICEKPSYPSTRG